MHYSKIIKLASYFKSSGNKETYFQLLKIASEDRFEGLVNGSYPSGEKNESGEYDRTILNEARSKRNMVVRLINDKQATISDLVKIINSNDRFRSEDNLTKWSEGLNEEHVKELEKLIRLTSEGPSASSGVRQGPERSDGQGVGPVLNYLFEKLKNIKSYHDSIELAKKEVLASEWYVERSNGSRSVGKIKAIDLVQKLAEVWLGRASNGDNMTKVISFDDILRSNSDAAGTKKLEPLEWLNRSYLYPLSIEKSNGGSYNNCIISDIITVNNSITCNFSFAVGDIHSTDFRYASKEIVIDMSNVASFYAANKDIISSF